MILLLDEVDSHLHPSAVKEVMTILKRLAANGTQIIMTTHSPTTVAMVEKENTFLLCEREDHRLQVISYAKSANRNDLIRTLTDEAVWVSERIRVVLVEGGGQKQDDFFLLSNPQQKV